MVGSHLDSEQSADPCLSLSLAWCMYSWVSFEHYAVNLSGGHPKMYRLLCCAGVKESHEIAHMCCQTQGPYLRWKIISLQLNDRVLLIWSWPPVKFIWKKSIRKKNIKRVVFRQDKCLFNRLQRFDEQSAMSVGKVQNWLQWCQDASLLCPDLQSLSWVILLFNSFNSLKEH